MHVAINVRPKKVLGLVEKEWINVEWLKFILYIL